MKKAAIYARVSTDKQEEQRTIESQLAELRGVCKTANVEVLKEYVDDGFSGATLIRPGLEEMRDDASRGRFEAVYILSPDRLSRKYVYQAIVIEELRKQGIEVVFLNKPVTDKPEDQLLLGIQGLIAEYERAQIIERTRRGRLHRARQGEIVTGSAPYGYNFVRKTRERPARYTINEDEASVVRLAFSLYLKHRSSPKIVKEFQDRGIRPRRGGEYWHACVINKMLRSESYVGRSYYNKTRGAGAGRNRDDWIMIKVPRIVDDDTFDLAQKILDQHGGGRKTREYLLSRLVRCKYCGSRYVGNIGNHGTTAYYRCANGHKRFPLPRNCFAKLVRAERLEDAVLNAIKEALLNPEVLLGHVKKLAKNVNEKKLRAPGEHEKLSRERKALEEKIRRLLDLYIEGGLSKEEYGQRKDEMERRMGEIDRELSELQQTIPSVNEETVRQSVNSLSSLARERLNGFSVLEMQQFLRLLIDEVTYDWRKGEAIIAGHLPLATEGSDSLFHFSGSKTPAKWNNSVLRFELMASV